MPLTWTALRERRADIALAQPVHELLEGAGRVAAKRREDLLEHVGAEDGVDGAHRLHRVGSEVHRLELVLAMAPERGPGDVLDVGRQVDQYREPAVAIDVDVEVLAVGRAACPGAPALAPVPPRTVAIAHASEAGPGGETAGDVEPSPGDRAGTSMPRPIAE